MATRVQSTHICSKEIFLLEYHENKARGKTTDGLWNTLTLITRADGVVLFKLHPILCF